ncbi:MAG: MarR family transcriptional regulator [Nitrosarchaeum sp.]|nr:MarR family transcriptional regulator [Nitrosarchaeum sp.]MCV0399376.1 MarR family transcriptional regulator [Nitrosarchaeum sp.]
MLIEIPEPEVILSVILAFIIGLGGLYLYYKIRPFIKTSHKMDSSQAELLEYYERQLIDMKIRLDAIELQGIETKPQDPNLELKQFLEKLVKTQEVKPEPKPDIGHEVKPEPQISESVPDIDPNDITEYVLHLITTKSMTSRDIQKALKRSREHTSRMMKKLFDEGLVERNTKTKPYTYSITEKGMERIGTIQHNPSITQ